MSREEELIDKLTETLRQLRDDLESVGYSAFTVFIDDALASTKNTGDKA